MTGIPERLKKAEARLARSPSRCRRSGRAAAAVRRRDCHEDAAELLALHRANPNGVLVDDAALTELTAVRREDQDAPDSVDDPALPMIDKRGGTWLSCEQFRAVLA